MKKFFRRRFQESSALDDRKVLEGLSTKLRYEVSTFLTDKTLLSHPAFAVLPPVAHAGGASGGDGGARDAPSEMVPRFVRVDEGGRYVETRSPDAPDPCMVARCSLNFDIGDWGDPAPPVMY